MSLFSFDYLIERFGETLAWYYLSEIEKAAGIRPCHSWDAAPETRLSNALLAQDAMCSPLQAFAA